MVRAIERKQAVQLVVHEVKETSMRRQRKEAMRGAELWKPSLGVRHPRRMVRSQGNTRASQRTSEVIKKRENRNTITRTVYLEDGRRQKGYIASAVWWNEQEHARGGGDGGLRYREDINILLIGDPGTSKSQILQVIFHPVLFVQGSDICVHRIAPQGVYITTYSVVLLF